MFKVKCRFIVFLVIIFQFIIPFEALSKALVAKPEDFGAKGDGMTDDTEAVQKAIDLSEKVILSGTYLCHLLIINKDIEVRGGVLKAFLDNRGNTTPLLKSKCRNKIVFRCVTFDGAVLNGTNGSVDSRLFLEFEGQKNIVFDRCTIRNHGISSNSFADCWYLRNNYALRILGAHKVEFKNCEFYANHEECICIGSNINTWSKKPTTKLVVRNCCSHNNDKPGSQALFLLFNLKSGSFKNCEFKDQGSAFINSMSSNIIIKDCSFENTPNRAITSEDLGSYYNCRSMKIIHNVIRNCKESAISVGNENIHIFDNTIEDCGTEAAIVVGRLICGKNIYGNTALTAIPFFDGSFEHNRNGQNIRIEKNTITCDSQIGVLIYCNYLSEEGSIAIQEFGSFSNIIIKNNTIAASTTPIQFGNGFYNNVTISWNYLFTKGSVPIILTTSSLPKFKGAFDGLTIEGNSILCDKPLDHLIVIQNATTKRFIVKKNNSSNQFQKSEYIQNINN